MATSAQHHEVADERGPGGETGAEIQVDMDGLVVSDLVQHLTSQSRQEALALLYHGSPCNHLPQDSTSVRVDGHPCLLICLNAAHLAFKIQKRARTPVTELRDTQSTAPGASNFMQAFFDLNTLRARDSCFAVDHDPSRTSKSLGTLIDENPFKEAFDKVLLYHLQLSREGYLRCFQLMWDNAPHLPMVAGVLTYEEEALVCLRFRASQSSYAYIILDCHVRPGSCHRGPTFSIHKSRESAAHYLRHRWSNRLDPEAEEDLGEEEFSLHILLQNRQSPPLQYEPQVQDTSNAGADKREATPPTPPPKLDQASGQKSKRNVIRNQASQNRLQSEFGWQMGLQDQALTSSPLNPTTGPSSSNQVQTVGDVQDGRVSPYLQQLTTESPPTIKARPSRGDLYKKDIGWQLALQEQVGGMTLPLRAVENTVAFKGHKSQKSFGQSSSGTSLSLKSGGSSPMQPRTPLASSSQAEIERQKPVRADIGWQHNLEAKSMTFPIQSVYTKTIPSDSSIALASPAFNTVGVSASSPSHLLATTEFGQFQDDRAEGSSAAAPEGSSEEGQYDNCDIITAECDYCFGPIVVDELLSEFGTAQCDHRICRDCLRRYILQELGFGNYPIRCPACMLRNRIRPTCVNTDLMDRLDFSDIEKEKFLSLEFHTLPVTIKCPKCGHSSRSSREDLLENKRRLCTSCQNHWCRDCHRTLPRDANPENPAEHACKDKKRHGLPNGRVGRYCPGCQTFVSRARNTNHAECPSTRCGLHFCFRCGEVIADTVRGQNPDRLAIHHYQVCLQPGNANAIGDPHNRDCVIQ